ncbi:MAG: PIN domain-containing protein [Deferribacteres bacterium]|nr:PIN domain-containing protein [Deferribacteres bacterium]
MNEETNFLLDTDITIYWLNNTYPKIDQKIKSIGDSRIFFSSISIAELFYGAFHSSQTASNLRLVSEFIKTINIINFDADTGKEFGNIKARLKKSGKIISDSDLFIAATALINELTLVTNNERHFKRIDNLKIENWTK